MEDLTLQYQNLETLEEKEGIWTIHESLPEIEGHVYQNGAHAGCLSTIEGKIYSVGKDIISILFSLKSLSWTTFSKPGPAFNIVIFENKPTIV